MEEYESLASEVTELREFQSEASEAMSQDDEDEVEELQNSLREVVQDQSVTPKLQCLVVDPSFSMVTVQSEDSGIVWEMASSRCSTPWASETSSISEAYSMEGSGAAGKITIVFDEDKIVRRRTRSGRSSKLGDRLSRPGSSRSASALGVERPEMAEVSVPNVKQDKTQTEPDLEEIKNKDQQLFSLISEGYEILNIRVPSKLPTVDEEESTDLQDNLSYLDQTPKIRTRNHHEWTLQQNHIQPEEGEIQDQEPSTRDSAQQPVDTELRQTSTQKESPSDIDYFEKFTLVDVVVPGEQAPELQEEGEEPATMPQVEEKKPNKEAGTDTPSVSEDSFVFVTDVEIVGEHLDEVFYGEGAPADAKFREDGESEGGTRTRRESQRTVKENGSVLFGSEDTVLTPIFISPGPPKIIDPILLEEPTAMSFMYSDLYEDAVGERMKSDGEHSEAESVASEKTYRRRFSDSEETEGYLEKFTLKDEIPTVEVQTESEEDKREGRVIWPHSKFDMTGCLTRVVREEGEDKTKKEEPKTQESSIGGGNEATFDEKTEIVTEAEKKQEEIRLSEEQPVRHESFEDAELREKQMEDEEVKHEVKRDHTDEPLQQEDSKAAEQLIEEKEEREREEAETAGVTETEQPCQTQTAQVAENEEEAAEVSSEAPHIITEKTEDSATDNEMEAAGPEAMETVTAAVKEPEPAQHEAPASTEIKTVDVTPPCVAPVEVITERDSAVHASVEVTEKEIQTQVHIDLQEVTHAEETEAQTADEEKGHVALTEETTVESQLLEFITEADQETKVKEEIESATPEGVQHELIKSQQHQQEESVTNHELWPEAKDRTPTEETGTVSQQLVNVGDELILLVPKGEAVEMDIEVSESSEKTTSDTVALPEADGTCGVDTPSCPETLQAPNEEIMTHLEVKADVLEEDSLLRNELNSKSSPLAPVEEEAKTEEQKIESDFEEEEGVFSPLRSFTPHEDLSGIHREEIELEEADVEQKEDSHKAEDAPETVKENSSPETELHREDVEQKMEHNEAAAEAPEVIDEELEYEIISQQDAKEMPHHAEEEETKPEPVPEREEKMEVEMEMEMEGEKVFDLSPEEELMEADYEIIDAEEEIQARLAAELQGMDWFCTTCGCLLAEDNRASGEHHSHEVTAVDHAYEEIKEKLGDWISELQARTENIEDLVSELELAYNSVEDQCVESEAAMQAQNEEMMALVMEQYNDMSVSMEEEKKAKLEQLYDQIVSFQESIDSAKATLETTAREAEIDARSPEDIHASLKTALDCAMSLELGPKGLLVFEDYAKGNTSSSHLAQRKGIPVPQRPTLQPQEPGSATSTSVTVYWKVNPGDIIDCFQVYCMEDPQGAVSEEYRVTVKESYSVLEELEPDKTYKVWVMAVNYTGCSLPSERLCFSTAPSVPVIDTERCTVMWDSATLRWSSANQTPEQNYTLEYCRQYELEGEGLRSISGIRSCEQRVLLQPSENYLFYIKAVNVSGVSEQSEAALISTKGTKFHLLKASAHPALELSEDRTTLHYCQDAHENTASTDKQCPSILGEVLPPRGQHYWETVVSGSTAYRLGVAYSTANRNSPLGENSLSWCLQCVPTPSGYQLLHNDAQASVLVVDMPERVGSLLDYQHGSLSFYNAQSGQLLGTFYQRFTQPCHPALALELPGNLEVSMVPEVPEFTKDS